MSANRADQVAAQAEKCNSAIIAWYAEPVATRPSMESVCQAHGFGSADQFLMIWDLVLNSYAPAIDPIDLAEAENDRRIGA